MWFARWAGSVPVPAVFLPVGAHRQVADGTWGELVVLAHRADMYWGLEEDGDGVFR
jgi:hypothetical protein